MLHSYSTYFGTDYFSAFNEDVQTEVVYIDFAKAFDIVCHRKLFVKIGGIWHCGHFVEMV